ncbi:MAG: hypothetical protein QMD78_06880 [Methanocellales archaeon]|nr:hypothetical protein [Methanocellales archaeon]
MKLKTIVQMAKNDPIPIIIAIWAVLILSEFVINDPHYPSLDRIRSVAYAMRLWVGLILILLMACTFVSKGKLKIIGEYLTPVVIAAWMFLAVDTVPPYEKAFTYFFHRSADHSHTFRACLYVKKVQGKPTYFRLK